MADRPHILVLGLGITGSAIAATLAEDGCRVTAFEQFSPLHERGSSHGDTRIFRRVPREGPAYVELASISWDGWHAWGRLAGDDLLGACGGIDAGPEGSRLVDESERLAGVYGQQCRVMSGAALNGIYPTYNLPAAWKVAYHPNSGYVRPDATRLFLHDLARGHGARLLHDTRVLGIDPRRRDVAVHTAEGSIVGDMLIVAAGGSLPKLLPSVDFELRTERRVIAWFEHDRSRQVEHGKFPIFCLDADGGWYGMPTPDGMLKLGHDKHLDEPIDPDDALLPPNDADAARLAPCIERYFQGVSPQPIRMTPCIYTLTPDRGFIIDRHPDAANIVLFSCCSGHGFKYAPAYGEIALGLVRGRPPLDLRPFALDRDPAVVTTRFTESANG